MPISLCTCYLWFVALCMRWLPENQSNIQSPLVKSLDIAIFFRETDTNVSQTQLNSNTVLIRLHPQS